MLASLPAAALTVNPNEYSVLWSLGYTVLSLSADHTVVHYQRFGDALVLPARLERGVHWTQADWPGGLESLLATALATLPRASLVQPMPCLTLEWRHGDVWAEISVLAQSSDSRYVLLRDISSRRAAEQAHRDSLIVSQLMGELNKRLSLAVTSSEAFSAACAALSAVAPRAWFVFIDAQGGVQGWCDEIDAPHSAAAQRLLVMGDAGQMRAAPTLMQALADRLADTAPAQTPGKGWGLSTIALPSVSNDLDSDKASTDRIWTLALRLGTHVLAHLVLTTQEARMDPSERSLIEESCGALALCLSNLVQTEKHRQAAAALQLQQRYLSALFDTIPSLGWLADTQGHYLFVTESLARIANLSVEACQGQPFEVVYGPQVARAMQLRHEQVLNSRGRRRSEELMSLNGQPRWFDVFQTCVTSEDGTAIGVMGFAYDITDRMASQEKVRRAHAALEEKVAQRTQELQAVNEELEAFSYSVSHDLRAPLRAIDGFAELLREDFSTDLNPVAIEYITHISTSAKRMNQLILDLLELARMNQATINRQSTDLSALALDITAELGRRTPNRRVEVIVPQGLTAHCDPVLARVVLDNLLANAWKFSSRSPQAIIEFASFKRSGATVFFVRDNGAGFDMSNTRRLFGAFQRFHHPNEFEGTGVGLATVKRIIRRHGGQVWAEGSVGNGATFFFTFDPLS